MTSYRFAARSLTAAAALALAACSHGPTARPQPVSSAPTSAAAIDAVAAMLDQGDKEGARKRLKPILKANPNDPSARLLSDSIERDPKELLGPDSFAYTTRAGDTMIGLSERFLGNRLKSYQLSRYNGIDKPASLAAGQPLRIPGERPRLAPPRIETPRPATSTPAPNRAKPPVAKRPAAAPPAVPVANPAAARQARAAGLAALNQGNVARAVGLLRRAAALDPGNAVIARDLQRAQRIAATVKSRR